jgi:glycosyltransferase involved in cell wall biosynthesis
VKIVMTLLARNEEDILNAHLAFHLDAGVDFVLAIDNGSEDGTTEILESYARDGYLDLTRDSGDLQQAEWVTRLARRAATEFGADWVINSDADEFYWPRGGTLKDVLAAVPARRRGVRGMLRNFAPRPYGDDFFAERMTARVCNPGAEDNSPYSPRFKTMHRGDPEVTVLAGSNRALGRGLDPVPGWYPIDVLHFPIRSLEHFTEKYLRWWALLGTRFGKAVHEAHRRGALREFYESYVVDDEALAKGVADGTLAIDTRLRDAMRSLRAHPPQPLRFSDSPVDAAYLSELARLEDGHPHVHVHRKAEDLEARLAAIEKSHSVRFLNAVSAWSRRRSQSKTR